MGDSTKSKGFTVVNGGPKHVSLRRVAVAAGDDAQLDSVIETYLPRFARGPNARRVLGNMARGGSAMRVFVRPAPHGPVMRLLWEWAQLVGAVPRTLRPRTGLGLVMHETIYLGSGKR